MSVPGSSIPEAEGRRGAARGMSPRSLFVGVTGASGAPYAARLLGELGARGCELSVCVSDVGLRVLAHELELPERGRDAVVGGLLRAAGVHDAAVFAPDELDAPPASGSSFPEAVVVCPCSLATAATIALGTTRNLIHRVGDVALKERRPLIVVPREMPLSTIHLRRLLELSEAGALIVPAMPSFYTLPRSVDDMVAFVVGRVLQALGFDDLPHPRWSDVR